MRFANGYGSIIKLGGNRRKPYAVRVTAGYEEKGLNDKGIMQYKQKYKYLGYYEKQSEANAALVAYNADPYDITKHNITFSELYDEWTARKFTDISKSTISGYIGAYNKCQPLYNIPFKDIKTKHLQAVIDANKHLSSIPQFKHLFNQLFNYALENDLVNKNYSTFVKLPKQKAKKIKIPFTREEIELLWNNLDVPTVDILLILLYSGLRISELLELKNENIHLKERYFFVHKSKTPAGIRNVPIHKKIAPLIEARYDANNTYLIKNKRGGSMPYNTFYKNRFKPLKEELGFNHTIHETRHTFISQCDRLDFNAVTLQRIVGHENENVTQHYTEKNITDIVKLIDLFDY